MSYRSRAPENAAPCRLQVTVFGREDLVPCQLAFRVVHASRAQRGPNLRYDSDTGTSNTQYLAADSMVPTGWLF